jgi:hypothetical protein
MMLKGYEYAMKHEIKAQRNNPKDINYLAEERKNQIIVFE